MKPTNILILSALVLSIGWGIVREFQQPEDNSVVSYEQLQAKKTEVVHLMEMLTDGLVEPKNKRLITKSGISSFYYVYENPSKKFEEILEKNINLYSNWDEFPVTELDDASAFKGYCNKDISLVLFRNQVGVIDEYERYTINVAWREDSYCWRQFQSNN